MVAKTVDHVSVAVDQVAECLPITVSVPGDELSIRHSHLFLACPPLTRTRIHWQR